MSVPGSEQMKAKCEFAEIPTGGLFLPTATGEVWLRGAECSACGRVSVPADSYGCQQCGADESSVLERTLTGSGNLIDFVTVHQQLHPERPAPCVVATIRLAEGPLVTAVIDEQEEDLFHAAPVQAALCNIGSVEAPKPEWRFVLARSV